MAQENCWFDAGDEHVKILVTGGKGVVGSALIDRLQALGYEVFSCDLKHDNEEQSVRCDVTEYRQLADIFKKYRFDLVYHLAAEFGRWNGEDYYEQLWKTNAIGTKNLIRLQEEYNFKMIFTSSSEVYGDYTGIMSEQVMDQMEIKQLNDYALSKWVNEMQILNSAAMQGTSTVRVRLFNVYGPGECYSPYRSAAAVFIYKALFDLPYMVFLNHKRSSLYIHDCARTLASIAERFRPGEVYNLAGIETHDIKTLSDMILGYLGKDDSQVRYLDTEPFTTRNKIADVSKAVHDLDFDPQVSLAQGIANTIEWMKEVYGVK